MTYLYNRIEKLIDKSKYNEAASLFLEETKTKISFNKEKTELKSHFDNETDKRLVYSVTLERGNRSFTFSFGDSTKNTLDQLNAYFRLNIPEKYKDSVKSLLSIASSERGAKHSALNRHLKDFDTPEDYDILSCLTKYDPDTFEDFCSNYGYEEDSIQAKKIYEAVIKEFANMQKLFTDDELDALSLIS